MTEQVTLIPGGIDSRRQHNPVLAAEQAQKLTITRLDPKLQDFHLYGGGKQLITIKPTGEMIVHDAQEAALMLKAAWDQMRAS